MSRFRLPSGLAVAAGLSLCLLAWSSNAAIERVLLGQASGTLVWGPTLFRSLLFAHGLLLLFGGVLATRDRHLVPAPASSRRAAIRHTLAPDDAQAWLFLAALSLVALTLRVWRLGSCLWFDEVMTLVDFVRPPLGQILTTFPSQNQHMLYSVLAHASIAVFGESAWALRLPSVLFGVASLWALFVLGRSIVGAREALLACTLMTVSYHHVWFSQNARGYTGLLFFATLATWLWLEAPTRRTWAWHAAYAMTLALGMWTHITMLFVPVTHLLLDAAALLAPAWADRSANSRRRTGGAWTRLLAAWLLSATLTLQLYALSAPQFLRSALHEVSLPSEWTEPFWVIAESWRSLGMGFGMGAAALVGLVLAGAGWFSLTRRNWRAGMAMLLPGCFGGMAMLLLGHNLWPRFFFFCIGFALLIAVHGAITVAGVLATRAARRQPGDSLATAAGVTLTSLMIIASALSLPRCYAFPKQDFTGARAYVERRRQPGDGVVAVGLAGVAYHRYFAPDWLVAQTEAELDAARRSHPRLWLVYTLPIELKTYRSDVWNVIQRDFEIVEVFRGTLGGGEVNVCRQRTQPIGANAASDGTHASS